MALHFVGNEQHSEIRCQLSPEVVQVEPEVTGLRNYPQFIEVNRCKGACDLPLVAQQCKPTSTLIRHVTVSSADGEEYVRDVEEHEACECTCQVTCNENQKRHDNECKCTCRDECENGEMQNPETCKCVG